jgi:hypothetical protein
MRGEQTNFHQGQNLPLSLKLSSLGHIRQERGQKTWLYKKQRLVLASTPYTPHECFMIRGRKTLFWNSTLLVRDICPIFPKAGHASEYSWKKLQNIILFLTKNMVPTTLHHSDVYKKIMSFSSDKIRSYSHFRWYYNYLLCLKVSKFYF